MHVTLNYTATLFADLECCSLISLSLSLFLYSTAVGHHKRRKWQKRFKCNRRRSAAELHGSRTAKPSDLVSKRSAHQSGTNDQHQ